MNTENQPRSSLKPIVNKKLPSKRISVGSQYSCCSGFSFYQPQIGFTNSSSNADVSTAGLQSSSGQTLWLVEREPRSTVLSLILSAFAANIVIILHICWGVLWFDGWEHRNWTAIVITFVTHMLISCLVSLRVQHALDIASYPAVPKFFHLQPGRLGMRLCWKFI